MEYNHIVIRYGEIALKGRNRRSFEEQLRRNILPILEDFPKAKLQRTYNQLFILLNGENYEPILKKLKTVFGIQSLSVAVKVANDVKKIQVASLHMLERVSEPGDTFKIAARRQNKNFEINSQQLNHLVGSYLLRNTEQRTVDVHQPDVEMRIEVKNDGTYISCIQEPGSGGLPVGSSGKVLLMLSGGIDSPVAGYLAMKRGASLEAIHFHSPPYTNERALQKVKDISQILTKYGGEIRLHTIPFTAIQQEIKKVIPDGYAMTVTRRIMLRIAEQVAKSSHALAIATGESLGQVASQTLESMHAINAVSNYPILRPLIAMDKLEIIKIAKQINTYEISIRPYEDCCTIFLPAAPKTKPRLDRVVHFEQSLPLDQLMEEAMNGRETETFSQVNKQHNEFEHLF